MEPAVSPIASVGTRELLAELVAEHILGQVSGREPLRQKWQ